MCPTRTVEEFAGAIQLDALAGFPPASVPATVKNGFVCGQGDVLGVITAGGLLRRRTRSLVGETGFTTGTETGSVVDVGVFKAGDVIKTMTGVKQQETATVAGTVTEPGDASVTVTGAKLPGGSKVFAVPIADNDVAAVSAGKIRTFLAADGDINDAYSVFGSGTAVGLEDLEANAYDSTLNIAIAAGTTTGLTPAASSVNTTPGNAVAATIGTIESIDEDGNVVLTGNAAVNAAEDAVVVGSDGSQVANCFADKDSDGNGDTPINVIIGGYLNESKLNGLDDSAKTELGGYSRANGIFRF